MDGFGKSPSSAAMVLGLPFGDGHFTEVEPGFRRR